VAVRQLEVALDAGGVDVAVPGLDVGGPGDALDANRLVRSGDLGARPRA